MGTRPPVSAPNNDQIVDKDGKLTREWSEALRRLFDTTAGLQEGE